MYQVTGTSHLHSQLRQRQQQGGQPPQSSLLKALGAYRVHLTQLLVAHSPVISQVSKGLLQRALRKRPTLAGQSCLCLEAVARVHPMRPIGNLLQHGWVAKKDSKRSMVCPYQTVNRLTRKARCPVRVPRHRLLRREQKRERE